VSSKEVRSLLIFTAAGSLATSRRAGGMSRNYMATKEHLLLANAQHTFSEAVNQWVYRCVRLMSPGTFIGLLLSTGIVCQAQITFKTFDVPVGFGSPYSITAGPDGALWFTLTSHTIADLSGVGRITTAGIFTHPVICGPTSCSTYGITTGPDNNIWYTAGTSSIGRVNPFTGDAKQFSFAPNVGGKSLLVQTERFGLRAIQELLGSRRTAYWTGHFRGLPQTTILILGTLRAVPMAICGTRRDSMAG
jgi:hypothetical protein